MNSVCIALILTTAPESRFTQDGNKQLGSAIATQQWEKNGQQFEQLIKVTAWRDVDRFMTLQKGDLVLFDASIKLNTVDKGTYKTKVAELNCNSFEVIGKGSIGDRPSTPKSSVGKTPVAAIAPPVASNSSDVPDYSDIPF